MKFFFFIFCIIVFIIKTQTVFSNNLIYDVNNIEVSGKINNDFDRKKIIQTAFQNAFTLPNPDFTRLQIYDLVKGLYFTRPSMWHYLNKRDEIQTKDNKKIKALLSS